jgi:hypothetical protein
MFYFISAFYGSCKSNLVQLNKIVTVKQSVQEYHRFMTGFAHNHAEEFFAAKKKTTQKCISPEAKAKVTFLYTCLFPATFFLRESRF